MLQPLQRLLVGPCLEVLAESERPILHLVSVLRAKSDSPHQHTPSCFLGRIASKSGGLISYATARRSHLVLHCLPNKTERATQCTERPDRKGGAAGNKSESFHLFVVTQATNAATNHFICTVTLHLARYVTEFWREGCKQVLWSGKFKTCSVPRCCGSDQKPLTVLLCFWLGVFCGRFLVSHNMP